MSNDPTPDDSLNASESTYGLPGVIGATSAYPAAVMPTDSAAATMVNPLVPLPGYAPGASPPVDPSTQPFASRLRASEGNTAIVNPSGYAGAYQFGTARLADLGLYQPADGESLKSNQWKGQLSIPGFPQVKTLQDFTSGPQAAAAQAAAYAPHIQDIDLAIATTPGAKAFSQDGLRAVAHLGGIEGMKKFVASGGGYNPGDANNTTLGNYYAKFSGQQAPGTAAGGSIFGATQGNPLMPGAPVPGVPAPAPAWVPPPPAASGPAKPVLNPLMVGTVAAGQALGGFKATPVSYDPFAVMPKNLESFSAAPWQTQVASGIVDRSWAARPSPRNGKPVIGTL